MTSAEIRRQFIDFFVQKHGHTFVPGSPVVPLDDPTLLFTNAGMNQFKPIFLGQERRSYSRAVNTQKCIRAGGKHNDLDDVGRSRRHNTFFEMLGNWSFGDYFKRGAIEMAWELLTRVWKLDPTRLHVSCFEGDEKNGIPRDTEAADLWRQIAGVPDDHIHYFGKDNFWEMGETGPCGPCTEIFIDRTPDRTGGPQVNGDDPRVMEIWNLVFIQYNRDAAGRLSTLPAQHVDTGMSLERICHVLQGKDDNYATDLFTPLFDALTRLTGIRYSGKFPATNAADPVAEAADPQLRHDIAFRVIADHVRCLTFALTDGAVPSNEGRGYVLRRILRRAVRFGRQQLQLRDPFLHTLTPVVVETMGDVFPELKRDPKRVAEMIRDEEVSFGRTIDRGIDLFEEAANRAKADQEKRLVISSDDAFRLHDTYGFPIDLTRIMAEERGMIVDVAGYERLMEEARERSRAVSTDENAAAALVDLVQKTSLPPTEFVGYGMTQLQNTEMEVRLFARGAAGSLERVRHISPGDEGWLVLERTPFYAESGGQVGDTGVIELAGGGRFRVEDTVKVGSIWFHRIRMTDGPMPQLGDRCTIASARVDESRRAEIMHNHTSTHVANWALREVLGDGVQQKGSLVDPQKLRFDFSHGAALTEAEVARVEDLTNHRIGEGLEVFTDIVPQERALKIHGLRAVFGEKYPPMVRVVSIGVPVKELLDRPDNPGWREFSIEFCGGTHLKKTSEAGAFAIFAEESVSKGVRRIVALTGQAARNVRDQGEKLEAAVRTAREAADADLATKLAALREAAAGDSLPLRARRRAQAAIAELQDRLRRLEKADKARSAGTLDVSAVAAELLKAARPLGPGKLVVGEVSGASRETLLAVIDSIKKKNASCAVLVGARTDPTVSFAAAVSDDLIALGLKAGDWIRETAKAAGGSGGGRPQMAQAGGKDPAKLVEALRIAGEYAERIIPN